jgi:hypothetical protein
VGINVGSRKKRHVTRENIIITIIIIIIMNTTKYTFRLIHMGVAQVLKMYSPQRPEPPSAFRKPNMTANITPFAHYIIFVFHIYINV